MLAFKMLSAAALAVIRKILFDKTVLGPITVVSGNFSAAGSGGRKIVKLSNGWFVAAVYETNIIRFYKSTDNQASWTALTYWGRTTTAFAIASNGTIVYCLGINSAATSATAINFDATTVPNTDRTSVAVDTGQNSFGVGCSLTVSPNGDIHAVWASKNATAPNAFNLRYSKSSDGATWAVPTQLGISNTTGYDKSSPCIVIMSNGHPAIIHQYNESTSFYDLEVRYFDGSAWQSRLIHDGGVRAQYELSVTVDSNGVVKVAWYGYDPTDTAKTNICYSESSDGCVTWSAKLKLTTGNTMGQSQATITCDVNNDVHVAWTGGVGGDVNYAIKYIKRTAGVWGAIQQITLATSPLQEYPRFCDNYKDFDFPSLIWKDGTTAIRSVSAHYVGDVRYDRSRGVVVDAAYDISGNGGRKIVRLSNGYLVSVVLDGSPNFTARLYVSKDKGVTWIPLCYQTETAYSVSVTSYGNKVFLFVGGSAVYAHYCTVIDVLTQTNVDVKNNRVVVDSGQTATGAGSITVAPNGDLHAVLTSKNATYPNSFNIRYSKSTNGGVTWPTPTQVTTDNFSGTDWANPNMVLLLNGDATIVARNYSSGAQGVVYIKIGTALQGSGY